MEVSEGALMLEESGTQRNSDYYYICSICPVCHPPIVNI